MLPLNFQVLVPVNLAAPGVTPQVSTQETAVGQERILILEDLVTFATFVFYKRKKITYCYTGKSTCDIESCISEGNKVCFKFTSSQMSKRNCSFCNQILRLMLCNNWEMLVTL